MRRRSMVVAICSLVVVSFTTLPGSAAGSRPGRPQSSPWGARPVATRPTEAPDALSRALTSGTISRATYAFERARSLFDLAGVRARYGDVARPGPRDATMDLRDLAVAYDRLSTARRRVADSMLARPTDKGADPFNDGYSVDETTPYCGANACLHWVTSSADAPDLTDGGDADALPDYVDTVISTFDTVWSTEITSFGFRPPRSDLSSANHGPNGKLDIYLADVGAQGYYGYCASDDPHDFGGAYRYWDASAFCVIDDDFDPGQFSGASGTAALQVTLAHEFFHAVQFAYDYFEDRWWMEGTATWIEDEVFDDVDDNVQYLPTSPLSKPGTPLDANLPTFFVYGDWIFFRFLSEYFGDGSTHDVAVVRDAWALADGAKGGRDQYSIQAVAHAGKAAGTPFRTLFARFGVANDVAPAWYDEGQTNNFPMTYPVPPLAYDPLRITRRHDTASDTVKTKHLTNTYIEFAPRRGVTSTAHLVIRLDLPATRSGSAASAAVVTSGGTVTFERARLDRAGDGKLRVRFGRGMIAAVDLVLTNASLRTRCWVDQQWTYSCFGDPKDDGLRYGYTATLDR